ncbi:YybS family protein [bacterium]|nr:YybS family protein [bacterium]
MTSAIDVVVSLAIIVMAMTFPASIVLMEMRRGRVAAWALLLTFVLICLGIGGAGFAAYTLAVFIASGPGLAYGFARFDRVEAVFLAGAAMALAGMVVLAAVVAAGMGLTAGDLASVVDLVEANRALIFEQYGIGMQADTAADAARMQGVLQTAVLVTPGANVALAFITAWLNLMIAVRFGEPGRPFRGALDFSAWSAPEPMVFGVLLPAVGLVMSRDGMVTAVAANVLIVAMTPFFFQGAAIVSHAMRRMRFSPGLRFLTYAFALAFMGAMLVPALATMGVLDIWLDFRRLRRAPAVKEEPPEKDGEGDA